MKIQNDVKQKKPDSFYKLIQCFNLNLSKYLLNFAQNGSF